MFANIQRNGLRFIGVNVFVCLARVWRVRSIGGLALGVVEK